MSGSASSSNAARGSGISLRSFLGQAVFVGTQDIVVQACCNRADKCRPGDVFIPECGAAGDQHDQVHEAVQRGARAVVAERLLPVSIPQCLVEDNSTIYARLCHALVGHPTERMLTIGVVGTHGKTSTALFIAAMLKRLGGAVAYATSLGTSDSRECDRRATRPMGARKLARWLAAADRAGAPAAVIEMAPTMLARHAAAGVDFDLLIVTGLRPGQHRGSPGQRQLAQQLESLIDHSRTRPVVLYNADDAQVAHWAAGCSVPSASYGIDASEHVRAKRLYRAGSEQQLLVTAGRTLMPLTLKIPGDHLARAAIAAVATAWLFEFPIPDAIAGVETLARIPGRMQRLPQSIDTPVHIDAADTPDRLAVALHALRQHQFGPTTVVHDLSARLEPKWRARLGEVLQRNECRIVLSGSEMAPEAVQSMAMDVLGGVKSPGKVEVIPDREAAIAWAIDRTTSGNVLLSGRGAQGWVSREGGMQTDESVACALIDRRNEAPSVPQLNIFPPQGPNSIFSH